MWVWKHGTDTIQEQASDSLHSGTTVRKKAINQFRYLPCMSSVIPDAAIPKASSIVHRIEWYKCIRTKSVVFWCVVLSPCWDDDEEGGDLEEMLVAVVVAWAAAVAVAVISRLDMFLISDSYWIRIRSHLDLCRTIFSSCVESMDENSYSFEYICVVFIFIF